MAPVSYQALKEPLTVVQHLAAGQPGPLPLGSGEGLDLAGGEVLGMPVTTRKASSNESPCRQARALPFPVQDSALNLYPSP